MHFTLCYINLINTISFLNWEQINFFVSSFYIIICKEGIYERVKYDIHRIFSILSLTDWLGGC